MSYQALDLCEPSWHCRRSFSCHPWFGQWYAAPSAQNKVSDHTASTPAELDISLFVVAAPQKVEEGWSAVRAWRNCHLASYCKVWIQLNATMLLANVASPPVFSHLPVI